MTANLRRAAGSLLVVGISGTEGSGLERAWMRVVQPAGVILFRRNIADAEQTRLLLAEATSLCAAHAFRCVDVEGGTVDRLRDALAAMPSAQAVARASRDAGPELVREFGELIAQGVKAFGFNVTLAPVLDLALPESAGVMGTRAAGGNADEVTAFARAFFAGLSAQGVIGCGKHFPGLGGGTLDSHAETPQIHRTWEDLWREDLAPYRALRDEMPMVMVNHASYPLTPGKELPATASPFWIAKVLRKKIGYRGFIFSDDMEMGGILKYLSIEEAAVAAIRAGMNTLEICHSPELILRAYEALLHEAETSAAFRWVLLQRARDAARRRERMFASGLSEALTPRDFDQLRTRMQRFGERIAKTSAETSSAVKRESRSVVETA
ncbi:beta-N-acetylhexosaminidase [Acidobacteria bacterium AB60]|nr:beta-N-acetylhexosaminidase [Acidobacteria bacterium AB60]